MKYYRYLKGKPTVHGAIAEPSLGMYIPTYPANLFIYSSSHLKSLFIRCYTVSVYFSMQIHSLYIVAAKTMVIII